MGKRSVEFRPHALFDSASRFVVLSILVVNIWHSDVKGVIRSGATWTVSPDREGLRGSPAHMAQGENQVAEVKMYRDSRGERRDGCAKSRPECSEGIEMKGREMED